MIDRKHYGIVVFPSSQAAAQAEIKISEKGWPCRLIPIPEQISAGCGLVLQLSLEQLDVVNEFISKEKLIEDGIYEVTVSKDRKKTVLPWNK